MFSQRKCVIESSLQDPCILLVLNSDITGKAYSFYLHSELTFTQVILICMAAVAVAAPQYVFETPAPAPEGPSDPLQGEYSSTVEVIPILKDERIQEDDGRYSVDVETGNGIKLSESGSPDGPEGAVIKAGQYE